MNLYHSMFDIETPVKYHEESAWFEIAVIIIVSAVVGAILAFGIIYSV